MSKPKSKSSKRASAPNYDKNANFFVYDVASPSQAVVRGESGVQAFIEGQLDSLHDLENDDTLFYVFPMSSCLIPYLTHGLTVAGIELKPTS